MEVYQQMARSAANVSLTFGLHQFSREEQSLRREVMAKQKLRQFDGSATNLNISFLNSSPLSFSSFLSEKEREIIKVIQ